jgi:CheY-like chemotaxis protein
MRNASCTSGEEALEELLAAKRSGDPFHFVVADYRLRGMDGALLAGSSKADPAFSDVLVVMMISISQWSEANRRRDASIEACLLKPVRSLHLLNTLESAKRTSLPSRVLPTHAVAIVKSGDIQRQVLVVEDNLVNQRINGSPPACCKSLGYAWTSQEMDEKRLRCLKSWRTI